MKYTTAALLSFATVLLLAVVRGDAKKRNVNLTNKERCWRICPAGRECRVLTDGRTKQCVCASQCKKKHKPVCGSDGQLYTSHCELHRTACITGKKISVDWDLACLKKQEDSHDCSEEKLSKMKQLILETFQKELQSKQVTSKNLIDELYFRYNRDGVDSISGSELKSLVTDYVMYHNIKELAEICHPTRWLKAQDKDGNGFLSKGEFSRSFASKPEVSILQNDDQPIAGSNITLQCQVRGYPVPAVTWFKDQMRLNVNDRVSMNADGGLFIKGLTSGDSGVYTCEALNDMGMDRKQVDIKVQEPVTDASVTAVHRGNMFYVFANDGVYVINPETSSTVNHIRADEVINGTTTPICTNGRQRACNWGGAVSVNFKYIYVGDFLGKRVLVLDIAEQKFVQEVVTDDYPYQLKYLRSLDAVWILCWEDSSLDVLTEDEDDNGTLSVIDDASKTIMHTVTKAQIIDGSDVQLVHGFFAAENCELADEKYGYVTHIMQPGLHEVDLVTKQYSKFYNLSDHQCYGTFHLALSQPHKYAFVQCYTNEDLDAKALLVIDLNENRIEAKSELNFGSTFASPDGRFILTLNYYAILTQYIDPTGQIFLFQEIESNLLLSQLAFYPRDAGYDVYVTTKDQAAIIVLHVDQRGINTLKLISTVGKPLQEDWVHTRRPIVIGCEPSARYLATPATGEDAVVILDAERQEMSGKVEGIKGARTVVWVENGQEQNV